MTTMDTVTITVDAILFDMDGTLIDSTPGVFKAWATFSKDYSLGDSVEIAHATHGRRLYDTLKEYCQIDDEAELIASAEIDRFENEVIEGGPTALPGAAALIEQLHSPDIRGWNIVTSASNGYAPRALARAGIPLPPDGLLVTSNDVSHGKPHPAPYLAGAEKCGKDPTKCLVVEDAIAGLKSGRAAGAKTLAVCTSTPRETLLASDAHPDYVVTDLTQVSARWVDGKVEDAIALNEKFKTLKADSSCSNGENGCVGDKFAQCVGGKFVAQACAPGTVCAALPLVNSPGTSITCTTAADRDARIAATGATPGGAAPPPPPAAPPAGDNNAGNGGAAGGDAQTSLTLDPDVIAKGFDNDGQSVPAAGQVASLTSKNNFINFCKTVNLPITNGAQVTGGSCNPAPMGVIPSTKNMPSSKFVFPTNGATIKPDTQFTIQMAIRNLETGNFVNAQQNYFAAPQQLNAQGIIRGHSHVVIELLTSMEQTTPLDPNVFAFFKGLNGKANGAGILTADVDKGLPAGVYKLSSINSAANHQPVLTPIAQHGSLDDAVYFTVA
ncbi:hypothetical protein D9615_006379 [Tricholomella constricta]|uniref:Uncharacterized protein n=1 Tax=Tricholomella constricta TaxID=117010 RepID=A0A8H5H5T8_9AGAR|nr:hypothetical protein D9615_006379 [Tricholomella constricta]